MRLITLAVLSVSAMVLRADSPEAKRRRRDDGVIERASTTQAPTTESPVASVAAAEITTVMPTVTASGAARAAEENPATVRSKLLGVVLTVLLRNPQASFADVLRIVPPHVNQGPLYAAYHSQVREISKPLWFHDDVQMLIRHGFERPNSEYISHFAGHWGPIAGFLETASQFDSLISNWMLYCNSTRVAALPASYSAPYVQRGPVVMLADSYVSNYLSQKLNRVRASLGLPAVEVPRIVPLRTPAVDTAALRNIEAIVLAFLAKDMFVTDSTILARATAQGIATTAAEVERIRLGFLWWTAQPSWFHSLLESAHELGLTDAAFPHVVEEIVSRAPAGSEYANPELAESAASLWYRFCFANGPVCIARSGGQVMPAAVAQQVFAEFLAGFVELPPRAPINDMDAAQLLLSLRLGRPSRS